MILQALYERYVQLSSRPDSGIAPPYSSSAKVSFALEISPDGELLRVVDVRAQQGKKLVPVEMIVPEQGGRSSNIKAHFLCDKSDYLLGFAVKKTSSAGQPQKIATSEHFDASMELHFNVLGDCSDPEAQAVVRFFERWDPDAAADHPALAAIPDLWKEGANALFVFRVRGQPGFVHQNPAILQAWSRYKSSSNLEGARFGQCLITGLPDQPIARTHEIKIKGVRNAQAAGASLVSFNKDAFVSFGKEQSYNAPVSIDAAFGYATALNALLASDRHRMTGIGDMTVVFWAGQRQGAPTAEAEAVEALFLAFFRDAGTDRENEPEPEHAATTALVRDLFARIRSGQAVSPDMLGNVDAPFYVLGLAAPSQARLTVRLWWQGEFGSLVARLIQHAEDMAIHDGKEVSGPPPLSRLLRETIPRSAREPDKHLSPVMAGELFRSILTGGLYPQSFLNAMINRIRADGDVNTIRVAAIKAWLSRYARIHRADTLKEVITVALNKETTHPAYRLGRLFAVLEKAQADAAGGYDKLNATIKDRYFGAASATPAAVFPLLIRLAQHHMAKSEYGRLRDMEIQEILDGIETFPAYLDLIQQGLFVLGYYHQKNEFFTKKS